MDSFYKDDNNIQVSGTEEKKERSVAVVMGRPRGMPELEEVTEGILTDERDEDYHDLASDDVRLKDLEELGMSLISLGDRDARDED